MTTIRGVKTAAGLIIVFLAAPCAVTAQMKPAAKLDCFGDPLPPGALVRLGTTRLADCRCAAFSPDGKIIAVASPTKVRLVDAASLRLLQTLESSEGIDGLGLGVVFSADSSRLAVNGFGGSPVDMWDLRTLKKAHFGRLPRRSGGDDWAASAVFAKDGKTLFVASTTTLVHVDVASGKARRQFNFERGRGEHRTVVFSPDGKIVATEVFGAGAGIINLWSVETGAFLRRIEMADRSADIIRFSPDSTTLAIGGSVDTGWGIVLWNVATAKKTRALKVPARTCSLAFSKDGKNLVSAHNGHRKAEQCICEWSLPSKKDEPEKRRPAMGIDDLILSPDEKTVAWRSCWEALRFLDLATGKELHPIAGHRGPIQALAFSLDGKAVASASEDGSVRLWDSRDGKQLFALFGHEAAVHALAYAPDGKTLASGGADNVVLWDPATGAKRRSLEKHGNRLRAVAFSPKGDVLAAGTNGPVVLWDPRTGEQLAKFDFGAAGLAFSRDGQCLYAAGTVNGHGVWLDWKAGRERRVDDMAGTPTSLAASPDGRFVAIGCDRRSVIADAETAKILMTVPGHHNRRGGVAFSPDSRYLASVGDGYHHDNNPQTIQIFEILTGKEVRKFEPYRPVLAVAFSPDGRRLATGGADTSALIWDLENLAAVEFSATLPEESQEKHWEALADPDPARAYPARMALFHAPKSAADLLGRKLRPARRVEDKIVKQWLVELDDNSFAKREQAHKALAALGVEVEASLRETLNRKPSAEVAQRVKTLLDQIKPIPVTRPDRLRELRSVEILERIDTPDALALLERLAQGDPQNELTREAGRALKRRAPEMGNGAASGKK